MQLALHGLIVTLFDEKGDLLCSNDAHGAMVGRDPASLVGKNWRDWTGADQLVGAEKVYARCLGGDPVSHMRVVSRLDGTHAIGPAQLLVSRGPHRPVVVGTMRFLLDTADIVRPDARAVAEYVGQLAAEMARMASSSGLKTLGTKLDDVAQQAGELTALLSGAHGPAQ